MTSLDRYYKPTEWWNLDAATRERVIQAHQSRRKPLTSILKETNYQQEAKKDEPIQTTQRKSTKFASTHPNAK